MSRGYYDAGAGRTRGCWTHPSLVNQIRGTYLCDRCGLVISINHHEGKFWQMHDLIIANPQKDSRQDMLAYAKRIGLDADRFQKDLDSGKHRSLIEADLQEAPRCARLPGLLSEFRPGRWSAK